MISGKTQANQQQQRVVVVVEAGDVMPLRYVTLHCVRCASGMPEEANRRYVRLCSVVYAWDVVELDRRALRTSVRSVCEAMKWGGKIMEMTTGSYFVQYIAKRTPCETDTFFVVLWSGPRLCDVLVLQTTRTHYRLDERSHRAFDDRTEQHGTLAGLHQKKTKVKDREGRVCVVG